MLEQRTADARRRDFDPLESPDAAGVFARGLAEGDPSQAPADLCQVLADVLDWRRLDPDCLQALRLLDVQGQRIAETLLAEYAQLAPQALAQERRIARAAFDLAAAFTQAFEHVLRFLRDPKAHKGLLARTPDILVRLLRYREIEMALTLCQYDTWQRARWKTLHDVHRLAREHGLATTPVVIGRAGGEDITVTPEETYLRTLLLDVAGGGQLLPAEIVAARRALGRFCPALSLRPMAAEDAVDAQGFSLDPDGVGGLSRTATPRDGCLWLDTSPLSAAIEREIAALHDAGDGGNAGDPAAAQRRLLLLSRLAPLYAAAPQPVRRRGERSEVALASAQIAFGGVAGIYRVLRDEARQRTERVAASESNVDEIVIGEVGIPTGRALASIATEDGTSAFAAGATWQVRDSSDSGCRLRGRAAELRWLYPGSLMAFREGDDAPWRLAVVRRLRKILGTNVEIGVERLSVDPQRVVLFDASAPDRKSGRTIAFYLPESVACPRVPIKTLVLPAAGYAPGRTMTMLSTRRDLRIRMKEPLEQQADFVWVPFDFVEDVPARDTRR